MVWSAYSGSAARVAKNKKKQKTKLKPSKSGPSPNSVKAIQMEPERLWRKGFVELIVFKPAVKREGIDRR